jgi:hypothetical protein
MNVRSRPAARELLLAISLIVTGATSTAFAWSNKEHIQITRMAAERLIAAPETPEPMRQWLRDSTPGLLDPTGEKEYFLRRRVGMYPRGADGLTFWATVPDLDVLAGGARENEKKVAPFGVSERLLHYIDLEYFMEAAEQRHYADDLSHKPKLADIPRDMTDWRFQRAGMLPFRVEQCYGELVKSIRAKRLLDHPGQFPRDEHATKWAGMLAHYAEDNTQPQHATADYKSASYFGNKRGAPNVHADVEYRLGDDESADYPELRQEFWALYTKALEDFQDPIKTEDPWQGTVEVSLASYDALPLIGHAAVAAYGGGAFDADKFFHFKGPVREREMTVLEMKAIQTAWAVKRVERLWRQAWDEATKPPPTTNATTKK